MRRLLSVASFAFLCSLAGCAGVGAVNASRRAVPVVVDESLRSFELDANRERLARIVSSPEIQGMVRQAAKDSVQGLLAGASEDQAHDLVVGLVGAITDALARDLREKLVPAVRAELLAPMRAEDRDAMKGAVDDAVTEATRTSVRAAAEELPTSVAPAVASSLVATLGAPALQEALDRTVSDATRSALVASADVMRGMRGAEGPTLVQRLTRLLTVSLIAAFLIGAGFLALTLWAVNLTRQARRVEALTRQLLDDAAKAAEGKPWADEMLALLAERMSVAQLRDLRSLLRH